MEPEHRTILEHAEIPPEYDALMGHGCACAMCMAGTQCSEGERLMAAWDATRPWGARAA
ncbi:hypothetical protein GCM10018987_37690 [Streptomyces cremeus]